MRQTHGPAATHLPATLLALLLGGVACPADEGGDEGNVLPTQSDSGSASGTASDATVSGSSGGADSSGGDVAIPAAYRFECIDIQILGDADGDAFQANLLEDTWNSDVDNFKLNIMFEVAARDDAGGTAQVGIRSGVGGDAASLCAEPTSQTDLIDITYDAAAALWVPTDDGETCSAAAPGGSSSGGSYTMMLPPEVLVYIYAQDTDGTTFNCTEDPGTPDAVPVRAVEAELTASSDGTAIAGYLTGCLLQDEAAALCSCLGKCNPATMNPNCGACPAGSVPLQDLLLGINPSQRCSDLMGMPAYDLGLGFSAHVLPSVPTTCGG
ncbi:MAG: hypothetical protein K1X88_00145 [Nannocystaceae bacterium]|nr:hypothetical protein [Nannocystaceae bacterium]